MEVSVSRLLPSETEADYEVSEKNRSLGKMPENCAECIIDESSMSILVTVPPKIPGVTCQVDTESFQMLVKCYESAVAKAVSAGASSVVFCPLGTKYQRWKHIQSASAARKAVEGVFESVPDGFRVLFAVGSEKPEETEKNFNIWNDVLTF